MSADPMSDVVNNPVEAYSTSQELQKLTACMNFYRPNIQLAHDVGGSQNLSPQNGRFIGPQKFRYNRDFYRFLRACN